MSKNIDQKYMKIALNLAKKGAKRTFPNPMVGCVIVNNGLIVGRGYHEYFGGPHAEVNALLSAKDKAKGATMYVTLEPCNHWGKTPPCAAAIIKAGISRIVAAMSDPNQAVAGNGFKELLKHNVIINKGIMAKEANNLNKFYIKNQKNVKSHVIVKAAMSLDGKIASRTGDSKWITGPEARKLVHKLRSGMDGIIVGINTVLKDNPALTSHGMGKNPVRIVIDPGLKTPLNFNILNNESATIIFHSSDDIKKINSLKNKGAILARVPILNHRINFKLIIKKLSEMSINKVIIEGGGETIYNALKSAVADEIYMFIAPIIIGGREAKTPVEGIGIDKVSKALRLKSWQTRRVGSDMLVHCQLDSSRFECPDLVKCNERARRHSKSYV